MNRFIVSLIVGLSTQSVIAQNAPNDGCYNSNQVQPHLFESDPALFAGHGFVGFNTGKRLYSGDGHKASTECGGEPFPWCTGRASCNGGGSVSCTSETQGTAVSFYGYETADGFTVGVVCGQEQHEIVCFNDV